MLKSTLLHAVLAATLCLSAPAYAEKVQIKTINSDGTITVTEEEVAPTPRTSDFVPVATLAGQTKAEIEKNFVKDEGCEKIKYGQKCKYLGGAMDIVFIGGKADWMSIMPENALFMPGALSQVGLPTDRRPTSENKFHMRWEGLAGLLSVQLNPGAPGKTDMIYVKAKTP